MIKSVKLVLFMLLMISNQVKALDVNINSNQDGIAYTKASYVLAQKKSCNITEQQKDAYLNSKSFSIKAQEENLIEKTFALSSEPCSSLVSIFNNMIEFEEQIFNRYPIESDNNKQEAQLQIKSASIPNTNDNMTILNGHCKGTVRAILQMKDGNTKEERLEAQEHLKKVISALVEDSKEAQSQIHRFTPWQFISNCEEGQTNKQTADLLHKAQIKQGKSFLE